MTEKLVYPSKFGHENCSAAQYLVEIVLERKAHSDNKNLPQKFWRYPEWKVPYKQAIIAANSLLKIYELKDISAALKRKNLTWVWSLRNKQLKQAILEESASRRLQKKITAVSPQVDDYPKNISNGDKKVRPKFKEKDTNSNFWGLE